MQLWNIIQTIRDDGWLPKDSETKFKEFRQAISKLGLPFVGRILLTEGKHYGGRIEELEFKDDHCGRLKFTITDCDQNGESRENAKTYRREVAFDDLEDIQTF